MTAVWFSSDTHFCHAMVAALRGFASTDEHDEEIIARWNARVRPADLVWHLGDVGLGNEARVLGQAARLNGAKHLVAGNHDPCWPGHRDSRKRQRRWLEVFESVQAFAKTRVDGRTVLLSHFPYDGDHTTADRHVQFRLRDEEEWLVHGHTHLPLKLEARMVHAGLDAWELRPVSEGMIAALIREAIAAREAEAARLAGTSGERGAARRSRVATALHPHGT